MMRAGQGDGRGTPTRQNLVFPAESATRPQETGMSGSYLSGDKVMGPRGTGGQSNPRVPPKRSPSLQQPFQPLPSNQGAFDLYGALDTAPTSPVPMADHQRRMVPKGLSPGGAVGGRANPRRPPPQRVPAKANKPAPKLLAKPLKGRDSRNGNKGNKLPSAKPVLPDIARQYDRMLTGYLDNLPTPRSSTVRIFLSSTFSDFKTERNFLIKNAYPVVRQYCQAKGLDFQVVDLRWGITDSSTNDHSVEALCLNEIAHCQRLSPGPNFVTMLGDRYGFRPIPTAIPVPLFETLRSVASDPDLLGRWYRRDYNATPPVHLLQDISTLIPHFGDQSTENEAKRTAAAATWRSTMKQLQEVLRAAALSAHERNEVDEATLHSYHYSVTEQEIGQGLLTTRFPEASCLAFFRNLQGINLTDKNGHKFKDVTMSEDSVQADVGAEVMMTSLKTQVREKLPADSVFSYSVPWREGGVLADHQQHNLYLKSLCEDFVKGVTALVDEQCARDDEQRKKELSHVVTIPKNVSNDVKPTMQGAKGIKGQGGKGNIKGKGEPPISKVELMRGFMGMKEIIHEHKAIEKGSVIAEEEAKLRLKVHADILHHLNFARRRCASFTGRQDELGHVMQFVTSQEESPPLVVTSPPGGGKTSFLAKVAEQVKTWLGPQAVVVVRFLGTSPASCSLLPLLEGLCTHISVAYGELIQHNALSHVGAAQKYLDDLFTLVSLTHGAARPLVLILDSIEGLSLTHAPYLLHWLPRHVPANIKILISLTPEVNNGLEHACAHLQTHDDTFLNLHLQPLTAQDAAQLVGAYPLLQGRTLTPEQQEEVTARTETLPAPLLVKLWLDEACLWKSYTTQLDLPGSVTEAVEVIFGRLEDKFGKVVVSATLGYLTLCLDGISEGELEDVLSADDDVMNDVYCYHNPPLEGMVRMPSLLVARLRGDLREYLVETQTANRTILQWYHKQFAQVAAARYTQGPTGERLHAHLAKVFLVEDKLCSTMVLTQRNLTIPDADRLVRPQPLCPTNLRKMLCVTHHLRQSGEVDKLKEEVLCNLRFLQCLYLGVFTKAHRSHAKALIWQALEEVDEESSHVVSALRLATPLVVRDLSLLPVQLLDQLIPFVGHHPHIASLCRQAQEALSQAETKALRPVIGRISSSPVNWYFEGPLRIISQSQDGTLLLVGYGGRLKGGPLFKVFDVNCCKVSHTVLKTKTLVNDILYSGTISRNNRRAYLLCKTNFVVYSMFKGGCGKVCVTSNNVNSAGALNECMVASTNDKMLVLAGPSRLAMFEDVGKTFDEPEFQVRRAMNFSGAISTTNLLISDDQTGALSSHTIQGQRRVIGAVSRWTFYSQDPCDKLPLPEPIPPGCLLKLPGMPQPDCLLAACADGKLYTLCMSEPCILQEIKNSVGLRGPNLLLSLHPNGKVAAVGSRDGTAVALFDLPENKMSGHVEVQQNVQALRLGPDEEHLTVLRRDGVLKVFKVNDLQERASVVAHEADTTSLFCPDSGHILTCAYDKTLKQFELGRLLKETGRCTTVSEADAEGRIEYAAVDNFCVLDGSTILTGHADTSPSSWDVNTGRHGLKLQPSTAGSGHLAVLGAGSRVLSLHPASRTLRQWAWPAATPIKLLPGVKDVLHMAVSRDRDTAVLVCENTPGTMVFVYNAANNEETNRVVIPDKIARTARCYLTNNSRYLVFVTERTEEDSDDGQRTIQGVLAVDLSKDNTSHDSSFWLEREVETITPFTPELFLLAAKGEVVLWQPPKALGIRDMKKYGGWLRHGGLSGTPCKKAAKGGAGAEEVGVSLLTTSPDERLVVTVGEDFGLGVWNNVLLQDLVDKTKGLLLQKHTNTVTCVHFSPDGKQLASGSSDKTVILWDASCGTAIAQMHTHARVMDLDFLPGGTKIIARLKRTGPCRIAVWELVG